MATDPGGFFSRWSRRKAEDTAQAQAAERAARPAVPASPSVPASRLPAGAVSADPTSVAARGADAQADPAGPGTVPATPAGGPTLDDVRGLSADSDFKPFVGRAVAPEVRNAAMKKLFADPHFNVMDGLDIYIDDYSKPSPLPPELLRKMVSAQFLQMVEEEKPAPGEPPGAPSAQTAPGEPGEVPTSQSAGFAGQPPALPDSPALGAEAVPPVSPPISAHDHPDLQLQPDHAPRRGGTESGA
jgi:hypothetical protein